MLTQKKNFPTEKEVIKIRWRSEGYKSLQSCVQAEPFKIASAFTDKGLEILSTKSRRFMYWN